MAVISADTFDPLRGYVGVRLQQGVPIADADWNAQEDTIRFALRAFLKWFVGDGVPAGAQDSFRIRALATPAQNDLTIGAGVTGAADGLRNVGRCLVDGMDVIIAADVDFTKQALHVSRPGSAALATTWGVPQVQMPTLADGVFAVYLDVWERLVTPSDDPDHLILPGLGTETCARLKREWVVRTRSGTAAPVAGDAEFQAGHAYTMLARLTRRVADGGLVKADDIADARHRNMTMSAIEGRLATLEQLLLVPAFAASPNQFNPKVGIPGASVTLFGRNLDVGAVAVRFDGVAATSVTAVGGQIVVTVPVIAAGSRKITVQTAGGSIVSDDTFTVLAPPAPAFAASPNQFTPKLGAPGTSVTLLGSNFNIAPVAVRFGATPAVLVSTAANQVTVTVPAMAAGSVQISIQTGGGTATSTDPFTVTA